MNELATQIKKPIGQGIEHTVFPFNKFKDKIIKTRSGNAELTNQGDPTGYPRLKITDPKSKLNYKEIKIFQMHPEIFAKVYKVTDRYAIIEKLDTASIEEDLEMLCWGMIKFFNKNPKYAKHFTLKDPKLLDPSDFNILALIHNNRKDPKLLKGIISNTNNKEFAIKLMSFIQKLYNTNLGKSPDLHDQNVGYDKEGNIKLLDF
jgi:hypothetical protein